MLAITLTTRPFGIVARLMGRFASWLGCVLLPVSIVTFVLLMSQRGRGPIYRASLLPSETGFALALAGAMVARAGREDVPKSCWVAMFCNGLSWLLCVVPSWLSSIG